MKVISDIGKQCRPRSVTAECGIWSVPALLKLQEVKGWRKQSLVLIRTIFPAYTQTIDPPVLSILCFLSLITPDMRGVSWKYFSYCSIKSDDVAFLMSTHNICFHAEIIVDYRYLKSKVFLKYFRYIRTSTYQICRIEQINRITTFHKWICNLTPEVRYIKNIVEKRWNCSLGAISPLFQNIFLPVVRFTC